MPKDYGSEVDGERLEKLVAGAGAAYELSDEVREGLLHLVLRRVEQARFGNDDLTCDDLAELSRAWNLLNDGMTAAEISLDWMPRRERPDET